MQAGGESDHAPAANGARPAAETRRVLIVDDNRDARFIMQLLLQKFGHEVETAQDGPEGLEKARHFQPEFVFCDIQLGPPMSGYDLAQAVRHEPFAESTWLIAVSGWEGDQFMARAEAAGFDRHLRKPVGAAELQGILAWPPRQPPTG
jgi:CheY-like chemotaxis protein